MYNNVLPTYRNARRTKYLIWAVTAAAVAPVLNGCTSPGYQHSCDWCDSASQAQLKKDVLECNAIAREKVPDRSERQETGRIVTTHGSTSCRTDKRGNTTCLTGSSFTYPETESVDTTNYDKRKQIFLKCANEREKNYKPDAAALKVFNETKPAAEMGDTEAQFKLGYMYSNGQGVRPDHEEAVKWSRLAAEKGKGEAQYNLGYMYSTGQGVQQDHKEAVKWFRLASGQGIVSAQNALGVGYAEGKGVRRNVVVAYALYTVAADGGNTRAKANRVTLSLSSTQIEHAQALSREMAKPGNLLKIGRAHV